MALIFSIGHSNRSLPELIGLLRKHGVKRLADVRTLPRSKFVPHFNRKRLEPALSEAGILYRHRPELGGLRKTRPDSRHIGLRAKGLRGYADYMETAEFAEALSELASDAGGAPLAFLCAEARPDKCHRGLLADALTAAGHEVRHIVDDGESEPHQPRPCARLSEEGVAYGADDADQADLFD